MTTPRWVDPHNHNSIGYGLGSLERALSLARERLDFWVFTIACRPPKVATAASRRRLMLQSRGVRGLAAPSRSRSTS